MDHHKGNEVTFVLQCTSLRRAVGYAKEIRPPRGPANLKCPSSLSAAQSRRLRYATEDTEWYRELFPMDAHDLARETNLKDIP